MESGGGELGERVDGGINAKSITDAKMTALNSFDVTNQWQVILCNVFIKERNKTKLQIQ